MTRLRCCDKCGGPSWGATCRACIRRERGSPWCRHCKKRVVGRPRGLCWTCFYDPEIRDLYPLDAKYGNRGLGISGRTSIPAPFPVDAAPGSEEKILAMQQRAMATQELFHQLDGKPHLWPHLRLA